jgi:hypothetical protein
MEGFARQYCRDLWHDARENARLAENKAARLAPIADFLGGDRAVMAGGMARLAMIMANGYERDAAKDRASGKYNPVAAGAWKHETMQREFLAEPATEADKALDPVMTKAVAVAEFWQQ